MGQIRNKNLYPIKETPILSDYFIGSDNATYNKKTVNFEMQKVADLFFNYLAEQLQIEGFQNRITGLGRIDRDENLFTFRIGFTWEINGNQYANTELQPIEIAPAQEGFKRVDIAVLTEFNTIELITGEESETIALQPITPPNHIFLCYWDIDGENISDPSEPVIGAFVTKLSFGETNSQVQGEEQLLQFNANGFNTYRLRNNNLVSLSGFSMQDILEQIEEQGTSNGIELPYNGKWFLIFNETQNNVVIEHNASTPYRFLTNNEQNFTLRPKQSVFLRFKQTTLTTEPNVSGIFELIGGATINLATDFSNPNNDEAPSTLAVTQLIDNIIPSGLLSGGIVSWSGTGFVYDVSQAVIKIGTTIYTIPAGQVTLNPSDETFDRIDVVFVRDLGFEVLTGTPEANPVTPQLEDPNHFALTTILVQNNTTEPGDLTGEDVYQENVEWTGTYLGSFGTADFEDTGNQFAGDFAINVSNPGLGSIVRMSRGSDFNISDFETVSLRIKLKQVMLPTESLMLRLRGSGGNFNYPLNFNKNLVGEYQLIAVSLDTYWASNIISDTVDRAELVYSNQGINETVQLGFFIDDWKLQGGISQPTPITGHNELPGLQGGTQTERFHVTEAAATAAEQLANPNEETEPETLVVRKNGEVKETTVDFLNTYKQINNFGNFNGGVVDAAYDANLDRYYVVGNFTSYEGNTAIGIARLMPDGSFDDTFVTGTGLAGGNTGYKIYPDYVQKIEVLQDSSLFICGDFTTYNGTTVNRIVKLLPDGSIDTSFASGTAITGFSLTSVSSFLVDEVSETITLVGLFSTWNGNSDVRNCLIRVNFDGTLDETFSIGTGTSGAGTTALSIIELDGSYFVSGSFSQYEGNNSPRIVRINKTTGAFESSFVSQAVNQVGGNSEFFIRAYLGKILVVGSFISYNNQDKRRILLLNLDGTIDESFNVDVGFARLNNATDTMSRSILITSVLIENDNTLLIPTPESLQQYNGRPISNIVRLSSTGTFLNNYSFENAPTLGLKNINGVYFSFNNFAFDPKGFGTNSFSPLNANFVAQYKYKGYKQNADGTVTSSSNLEPTEANTQSTFITRRDARGLIKAMFFNFTTMFNKVLRLFDFTRANEEAEPDFIYGEKDGQIVKVDIEDINPDFDPSQYDLDEFQNESADPYVRESEIASLVTNTLHNTIIGGVGGTINTKALLAAELTGVSESDISNFFLVGSDVYAQINANYTAIGIGINENNNITSYIDRQGRFIGVLLGNNFKDLTNLTTVILNGITVISSNENFRGCTALTYFEAINLTTVSGNNFLRFAPLTSGLLVDKLRTVSGNNNFTSTSGSLNLPFLRSISSGIDSPNFASSPSSRSVYAPNLKVNSGSGRDGVFEGITTGTITVHSDLATSNAGQENEAIAARRAAGATIVYHQGLTEPILLNKPLLNDPTHVVSLDEAGEEIGKTPFIGLVKFSQNKINTVTVDGTTSEVSLLDPTFGSTDLDPDDMFVGAIYRFTARGEYTANNSDIIFRLKLGSEERDFEIFVSGNAVNRPFRIDAELKFIAGANDARECYFSGVISRIRSNGEVRDVYINPTTLTVDAESAKTFDLTVEPSDNANEISVYDALLTPVN